MLVRSFVYCYFPLVSIGLGLSQVLGSDVWQGLVFVLAATYVYVQIARKSLAGKLSITRHPDTGILLTYAYVVAYSVLFFPRWSSGVAVLGTAPTLFAHLAFWHLVYRSPTYKGQPAKYFRDVMVSLTVGFMFAFGNALAVTGFTFKPGSIHDIAYQSSLVRSDFDGPFLALAPIALCIAALRNRDRRWWILTICSVALLALWVYSRRGPMLGVLLMLGLAFVPKRAQAKVLVALLVVPFLPILWERLAPTLIEVSQSDLVKALVARDRPKDYLTATGRLSAWSAGFAYLANFRLSHLIGYGGTPGFLLSGAQEHMHNMVLQLFFDAGLITVGLGLSLIVVAFRKLAALVKEDSSSPVMIQGLFLFFCSWILLSAIEPTLRSFGVPHLVLLIIAVSAFNRARELRLEETPATGRRAEGG